MRKRFLLFPCFLAIASLACQSTDDADSATRVPDAEGEVPAAAQAAEASSAKVPTSLAVVSSLPAGAPLALQDEGASPVDIYERRRQQRAFLVEQFIARGDEERERGNLSQSLESYAQAVELDPTNQEARRRLRDAHAMMGRPFAEGVDMAQDLVDQENVRRQLARLEASQNVTDGDNQMRLGNYDAAIEHYRKALLIVQVHPLIVEESLDERLIQEKLASAADAADAADTERRSAAAAAAQAEAEREEIAAREFTTNKLRELYREANSAFHAEKYSNAEMLADQILLYDPGNEAATAMREIAQEARHLKADETLRQAYRENWILTFEDLNQLAVPPSSVIEFERERWAEVQQRKPFQIDNVNQDELADNAAVMARLEQQRLRPRFGDDGEGADITEIAQYLSQVTGVDFLVSTAVLDELDDEERAINLDLPERSVRKTLEIIADLRQNLKWKVEDGVVKFVTADELVGGQIIRFYEVRDLIRPVVDFPAKEINITPSGGPPEFDEDIEEREALVITEDSLDALIRDNIAVNSWDFEGSSLSISSGTMVVRQTPAVHDMIQKLLDDLREATGIMVDIQTRFLTVEDNFLEDIGVDFRGLGTPGLGTNAFFNDFGDTTAQQTLGNEIGQGTDLGAFYDNGNGDLRARAENLFDQFLGDEDVLTGTGGLSFQWTYLNDLQLQMVLRAVSKSERVELVTAPRLLVFNTARSNVTVTNQVAYVQDYDVEIAQAASIADPIISVVQDGVILDVRPVVSADRRFITLELRPTVATLQRPIATLVTSLGVSGNPVVIQLPEIDISRVRTSVPMPDGGTVLLGGFKIHENQDLRSGVPILNKIPLLRFLFERKGNYVTNRKLLVLLKANIVILAEHEPTPAQLGLAEGMRPR
ncbi:MAG: hypothetical protein WD226_11225 [Planctomycetota bacterium]